MRYEFGGHIEKESVAGGSRCLTQLQTTQRRRGRPGDPCVFVIFGATGDLTKRLLMPALYNLLAKQAAAGTSSQSSASSNVKMSSEDFRKQLGEEIKTIRDDPKSATSSGNSSTSRISYMSGDFKDPATYTSLKSELEKTDKLHGTPGNYLSTRRCPQVFSARSSSNWPARD